MDVICLMNVEETVEEPPHDEGRFNILVERALEVINLILLEGKLMLPELVWIVKLVEDRWLL